MSEIKPCPFCRFSAHDENKRKEYWTRCLPEVMRPFLAVNSNYAVVCGNCGVIGNLADTEDMAISYWNEQQWEECIEMLVEALRKFSNAVLGMKRNNNPHIAAAFDEAQAALIQAGVEDE